jgi:redox-sensitive bicupin YhaK (pirin superfamily)
MAGFQLWVNLPASLKMTAPRYQEISAGEIPVLARDDGTLVRVIAGRADGVAGPVTEIAADPIYLDITLPPKTSFLQPVELGHTALAYVFKGSAAFGVTQDGDGHQAGHPALVLFEDGDQVEVRTAESASRFLFMSGAPLYESIARYGPFVMNTREEILQALKDLQDGTFIR